MYGCESWIIKKAEHRRTDAFELWCWRRLLRVRWTARRYNQSILKEISPEYSLEGLMLKLKLQYLATLCEELTHWKRPWCWERLKAGGEADDTRWDGWMALPTQWTWVWASSRNWLWTEKHGMLPGASERNSAHGKGHEEGGFGICKGRIEPQESPCSQASTPKTRVCLLYCFMLSPIPLTLWRAVHHLSRRRS